MTERQPPSGPITCQRHGRQPVTFVCRHLADSVKSGKVVGFHASTEKPNNPRPDAWCDDCERVRLNFGGNWRAESEDYAQVTLLCGSCYDEARDLNQ